MFLPLRFLLFILFLATRAVSFAQSAADFNFTQNICNPNNVEFSAIGNGLTDPAWDFGDGGTATGALQVNHLYAAFGTYTVVFTAKNGANIETISKTIRIDLTNDDLIITNDTIICHQTTSRLRTKPLLDVCWFPADYLDDPRSHNPVSSAPHDITYYLNAKVTDVNRIVNGDFSAGNASFTTDYQYTNSGIPEGTYWVGANPQQWHPSFSSCGDHTTGTGNMMVVNGSSVLNMVVWKQTITVTPHTNYAFSTWIQSALPTNPALLQFSINGNNLSGMISAPGSTCNWSQFYTTWNSGNSTTATIAIVNQNLQSAGNDFALDDISFAEVVIKRDFVKITVEKPDVKAGNDITICKGTTTQLNATGAIEYSWLPATGLSDAGIQNPLAKADAFTEYTVTGKNARGCTAQDKVIVDLHPRINVVKTPDRAVCRFSSVPLQVSGGVSYNWFPSSNLNDLTSDHPIAQMGDEIIKFRVTITDIFSCKQDDSITIDIIPYPVFEASAAAKYICTGTTVTLNADGGDQYTWTPAVSLDDPQSNQPIASPTENTRYSVLIEDNTCGFDSTIHFHVTVNPLPVIQATKSNDINCNQPTAILKANGASSYSWWPVSALDDASKSDPVAAIDTTTTFRVTGRNQYGCESTALMKVFVSQTGIPRFVVPNAFSPNGDGKNDCFGIKRWGNAKVEEFAIYNRWGQLVFRTNNPSICWDGRFNGQMQPIGAYAYVIRARAICGPVSRKGMLMLVR